MVPKIRGDGRSPSPLIFGLLTFNSVTPKIIEMSRISDTGKAVRMVVLWR
jgi:hypothetical protein